MSQYASSAGCRHTAMQNVLFLAQWWPKPLSLLVAFHGGVVRLSGLDKYLNGKPTSPHTNWVGRRLTLLM